MSGNQPSRMRRVHVVGRKNAGKTTLIVDLVRELVARGVRVGTIKHSGHWHEPDTPGKDSYRHREAGGRPAALVTAAESMAVFLPNRGGEQVYADLDPLYADCDLVLVEGGLASAAPQIEVWRAELGDEPLARSHPRILAVVSDDSVPLHVPVWPRADVGLLADRVMEIARSGAAPERREAEPER